MAKNHKEELADIELESAKLDLAKKKADTYVGILKDIILGLVIFAGTIINFLKGNAAKAFPTEADVTMSSSGMGSGVGTPMTRSIHFHHPVPVDVIIIWGIVILAIVFLVLPRIKKFFTKKDKK